MKIIDEKGRLFGKINIIDFLVILFLFCLTPMFYFGYKAFRSKPVIEKNFLEIIELSYRFIGLKPELLKLIAMGDKEIDNEGRQIGEIIWIGKPQPFNNIFVIGSEEKIMIEDPVLKQLPVKLKLTAEIKGSNLYYNDQQITINLPFEFKSNKYIVQAIPSFEGKEKWMEVKVKFSGLGQEISTIINEGHIEKDKEGRIVGKLKTILTTTPTQVSALKLEENKFIFINDPYRSDIVILMDILCTEKENTSYFKNFPVKIGSQINFTSDLYIASGTIIGIEKYKE